MLTQQPSILKKKTTTTTTTTIHYFEKDFFCSVEKWSPYFHCEAARQQKTTTTTKAKATTNTPLRMLLNLLRKTSYYRSLFHHKQGFQTFFKFADHIKSYGPQSCLLDYFNLHWTNTVIIWIIFIYVLSHIGWFWHTIDKCFSTFFGLRHPVRLKKIWWHPYLAKMTIQGTLRSKKTKKVVNAIFDGTPDTFSRHPCVPRHPGWEPLP